MNPEQIIDGARTVVGVGEHFQRLQRLVDEKLILFAADEPGYCTPTEDEEVRHLLVSYWQSRNALVELVSQFHADTTALADAWRPAGFLVAYAGALCLVDAARFLREAFRHRPIFRAKLNEPEPQFGIPNGTFDTIQRSLTSPVHAWHLYHAARYFDQHQASLRAVAGEDPLASVLDLIDRLRHHLQVRLDQYAVQRARDRATQLATKMRRDLFGRALYGLQRAASRLISDRYTVRYHCPAIPPQIIARLTPLLEPGDVLITRKDHALTNYFLPGYWPHAALYLGTAEQLDGLGLAEHANLKPRWRRLLDCDPHQPRRVVEALKDGVWIRSTASPFASDALLVLRPRLASAEIAAAIARGLFHEGKPYDFDFDFTRSDRLVCTEVVYRSYEGIGGVSFRLTRRAGRLTLSAEDLIAMALAREHFEPVAVYAPAHENEVQTGSAAEAVIRRTLASCTPPPRPG